MPKPTVADFEQKRREWEGCKHQEQKLFKQAQELARQSGVRWGDGELDADTRTRVVEELLRLLTVFHEAENRNAGGLESVSRRGQLGGFRGALEIIVGRDGTSKILASVRSKTGLGIPHVGPVQDDGKILGMDSEANLNL